MVFLQRILSCAAHSVQKSAIEHYVMDIVVRSGSFASGEDDYSRLSVLNFVRSREEAYTIHAARRHIRCPTTLRVIDVKMAQTLRQSRTLAIVESQRPNGTTVVCGCHSAWMAGMLRVQRGVDATGRSTKGWHRVCFTHQAADEAGISGNDSEKFLACNSGKAPESL
jgi:hypothetical protein